MRAEDIIQAAMSGQRIEQIPKVFDFSTLVEKLNQVLSYEIVNGFSKPIQSDARNNEISDAGNYTDAGIGLDLRHNNNHNNTNGSGSNASTNNGSTYL